jgi:hypothetical protein
MLLKQGYLIKYEGSHYNEVVWIKLAHVDHKLDMVAKFEQEKGHELGIKKFWKKKNNPPTIGLNVDEGIKPL